MNTKVNNMNITFIYWFVGRNFLDYFKDYGQTVPMFRFISLE